MRYYVVSDIHGFYTELERALRDNGFFDDNEPNKLILCGDALDRGKEAQKTVELLLKLLSEDKLIYIRGNHEDLLVRALDEIRHGGLYEIAAGMSVHYSNGTWSSLLQLAEMTPKEAVASQNELLRRVKNSDYCKILLPKAIDYFETENYIFCHGWIPTFASGVRPYRRYSFNDAWRKASEYEWEQARWLNGMELACKHKITIPEKTIVCGHFHTSWGHSFIHHKCTEWNQDAIFEPFYAEGIIALDACTAHSEKVNCIIIDD